MNKGNRVLIRKEKGGKRGYGNKMAKICEGYMSVSTSSDSKLNSLNDESPIAKKKLHR